MALTSVNIFAFANNPARQKRKRIQAINDKYTAISEISSEGATTSAQQQQIAMYQSQIAALGKKRP